MTTWDGNCYSKQLIAIIGLIIACVNSMKAKSVSVGAMPKVMTVSDLAGYLRVHRTTIYRLLKNGGIPAFRVGSDWRFNTEAIDNWRMGATFDA